METPSGHPSSPPQISTNSKQPKTLHSESSQAASQTQISNIYTQTHKYSHSVPISTPYITTQTKSSTSCVCLAHPGHHYAHRDPGSPPWLRSRVPAVPPWPQGHSIGQWV